jgi:hypothetical protein
VKPRGKVNPPTIHRALDGRDLDQDKIEIMDDFIRHFFRMKIFLQGKKEKGKRKIENVW